MDRVWDLPNAPAAFLHSFAAPQIQVRVSFLCSCLDIISTHQMPIQVILSINPPTTHKRLAERAGFVVTACSYVSGAASHYPEFAIVDPNEPHAGKEQVVLVAEKPRGR